MREPAALSAALGIAGTHEAWGGVGAAPAAVSLKEKTPAEQPSNETGLPGKRMSPRAMAACVPMEIQATSAKLASPPAKAPWWQGAMSS